ncbi:farnesyl pyrophosphate synthetase [Uncinocarpus reesii 1704]|uniref:Farnesyl pyrophosphate synthetase n=1 Tax=Uncinocarpus reesii (strain UAMH 1704) TaxID=336963 RepID=C4JMA5_UNCRE|nr:farnesyl pyrophosphate synthetase [Uncinocarpus reesii 1704]EEP79117.1 farnesyl pyrophosphate synthetase [Uncinocarpus reesii 1704]
MATKTSRADFEAVFPSLVQDLSEHAQQYGDPYHSFGVSLNANTPGGKLNRGLSVPDSALSLLSQPLNEKQFKDLCTLGWLTELLQAFFLVSDDMMDASITRRGEPCWYRREGVGMIAINDSFMLESSIYVLLKKHFRSHPAYVDFLELFHETTHQTELGQLCDLLTAPEDHTAYYSFYLPVALALHYLELATPKNLKQAHDILIPLGEYFQAQDDFLDVFGRPEQIGKIGTDIQDNKCSWVINQALLRCSPEQRKVLDESYGRKDKDLEAKVKVVFNELDIVQVYRDFEEEQVGKIRGLIAAIDESEGLKKGVFESFLAKIYKRDK